MNSYFLEKGLNKFSCLKSGMYERTRQTYLLINKLQVYSRNCYVSHITTVKKKTQAKDLQTETEDWTSMSTYSLSQTYWNDGKVVQKETNQYLWWKQRRGWEEWLAVTEQETLTNFSKTNYKWALIKLQQRKQRKPQLFFWEKTQRSSKFWSWQRQRAGVGYRAVTIHD